MCVCGGLVEAGALGVLIAWLLRQRKKLTRKERRAAPPRLRDTLRKGK